MKRKLLYVCVISTVRFLHIIPVPPSVPLPPAFNALSPFPPLTVSVPSPVTLIFDPSRLIPSPPVDPQIIEHRPFTSIVISASSVEERRIPPEYLETKLKLSILIVTL